MPAWAGLIVVLAIAGVIGAACGASSAPGPDPPRDDAQDAPPAPVAADADATEEQAGPAAGADLFLPPDAVETPQGDRIIRDDADAPFFGRGWETNWDVRIIELNELMSGGPPRDGIPSIDEPQFETVAAIDERGVYDDNSPVIQFMLNGDVRAYPLAIMTWHEIVNDVVGGVPVAVTFCPLCNSAIAFDRRVGGETLEFGTSGLLRQSDLVMYDRTSESLWQQIGGKAIVGDMVGAQLDVLPSPIVSWAQFRAAFPEGLVLSQDTGFIRDYGRNPYSGYDDVNNTPFLFRGELDERLSPFERVVALEMGEEVVAYPFLLLEEVRVVTDTRAGQPIVVFWAPGASSALDTREIDEGRAVGSTGVFARTVGDQVLDFLPNPDDSQTFRDEQTGSTWNVFGEAIAGPMAGATLEAIPHGNHFWFAWAAFQPETEVVTEVPG